MDRRRFHVPALAAAGLMLLGGCQERLSVRSAGNKPAYPAARKDTAVDDYYGVQVADPYRWLEDAGSAETHAWVAQENELTERFLGQIPARKRIASRLKELMDYARYSAPSKEGGRYFFWKNEGLQNQSVLYVQETLAGVPREVLNPNLLSKDGTVAVATAEVSWDGKLLAYGLSRSGSDEQEVKVRDIDSGRDYEETLRWCRFTTIAWPHDGRGFFYSRYPDPNRVAPEDRMNYNRVYWHTLRTPQSQDKLIYERPDNKELSFATGVTDDGKYVILYVEHGTDPKNRVYYRPVDSAEPFVKLLDKADARYEFVGNQGSTFYFNTDLDAPRGRLIAIDLDNPAIEHWQTLIPEGPDVLDHATIVNNQLVVVRMHDVHHQLKLYRLDGTYVRDIALPTLGTVAGLHGRQSDTEMFLSFTSFLYPSTSFRYDFAADELSVVHAPKLAFDASAYETKQVFYSSKDGTRVPMFVTCRKGLKLDGNNPTLLYGYGGFDINLAPNFSPALLLWLERGGVYAQASLRGGSEYGEAWHQAGMLDKKQNVFDDFLAAAEWLIANNYTRPAKLAIRGGSNGGLLTAACMLQRPDLYGAVVCQVPVTDMLRYHKFTVGRYWVPEYGSADAGRKEFDTLYAYSPLHNVREGAAYPPILITSADTDDRVVPSHAKKFAATLQEKAGGANPILLRVETKAGHGGGKPTAKIIEEQADIYAFLEAEIVHPAPADNK
jgi:prolyl oligopeptidase